MRTASATNAPITSGVRRRGTGHLVGDVIRRFTDADGVQPHPGARLSGDVRDAVGLHRPRRVGERARGRRVPRHDHRAVEVDRAGAVGAAPAGSSSAIDRGRHGRPGWPRRCDVLGHVRDGADRALGQPARRSHGGPARRASLSHRIRTRAHGRTVGGDRPGRFSPAATPSRPASGGPARRRTRGSCCGGSWASPRQGSASTSCSDGRRRDRSARSARSSPGRSSPSSCGSCSTLGLALWFWRPAARRPTVRSCR